MSGWDEALGNSQSGEEKKYIPGLTFDFEGKSYPLRAITFNIRRELARNVYKTKIANIAEMKTALDPVDYQVRLDTIGQKFENGYYAIDQEEGRTFYLGNPAPEATEAQKQDELMRHLDGLIFFCGLIFGMNTETLTRAIIARPAEVLDKFYQVVRVSEYTKNPNDDAPPAPTIMPGIVPKV